MEVWLGRTWSSSRTSNTFLRPSSAYDAQKGCTSGAPRDRMCREKGKNVDGWRSRAPFSSCAMKQDTPHTLPRMNLPTPMSFHRS